jgi:hypothetical protein
LQRDGRVVVLVGEANGAALAAADVGIGLARRGQAPQWTADARCERSLCSVSGPRCSRSGCARLAERQLGWVPGFHLMPQPMLGWCGSGTGSPARTLSSAARSVSPLAASV